LLFIGVISPWGLAGSDPPIGWSNITPGHWRFLEGWRRTE
jgi:hypothetical protein